MPIALAISLLLATAATNADSSTAVAKPKIGSKIAGVSFVDLRYLKRTLSEFGRKKAFVIVFMNCDCPIAQRYLPRLKKLDEQYREKGVQFLSLNVGTADSVVDVAAQALEAGIAFPFAKDFDGSAARKLGVTRTPEAVVLDAQFHLRYRGRIDGNIRFGGVTPKKTRADLEEAIRDVLAGKKVRVSKTPVDGCLISFPDESKKPQREVTYSRHIAPLMQKYCQKCHRPGTEAPFSLLNYSDAKKHAAMIGEVVMQRRMPPWFASEKHGKFSNKLTMTSRERRLIADWIRGGKREGNPKHLPQPLKFSTKKWRIGKPDLVIRAPSVQKIPAEGYVPYRYVILPHVFLKDTWVQDIEILPGNKRVVHHCNLAYFPVGLRKPRPNFITGFVPGGIPMTLGKGVAFKIPAGSMLVLQLHYVTIGKETTDRTSVGFRFPKSPVKKRIRHVQVTTRNFAIPPGASHHEVVAERTLRSDAVGMGMFVHMHLRGKDMTFQAITPDGKKETLLVVPNYSFDWQMAYRWKKGTKTFPKGTRIRCVAHYDNSAFNPYNPDPKKTVRFGLQTYHEMMYGFFFYLDQNEDLNLKVDPKTGHVASGSR